MSSIQIVNMKLKLLMSLFQTLVDGFLVKNKIFMVKTTGVRGPTLARLAMVLVLLSIGNTPALQVIMATTGEPSTWFPLG